jgi:M6 family metalloprotease-like protein
MNAARTTISVVIIVLGLSANINSDIIDDWLSDQITINENNYDILVGVQDLENWLVIPVSFQDDSFNLATANSILNGENSARSYIQQITNGQSSLNATILDEVWISSNKIEFWGADGEIERDSGSDGLGVTDLVERVVKETLAGKDLSAWDLDNDGILDRILILHSAKPQEIGGGSNSIWSHMSGLDESVKIGDWSIEHYTIASTKSGMGTLVHEMLHQMGAYDLYDVHSSLPTSNWNGIGDWGIMASGNWNGNGASPAFPSSATLELIGINRSIVVDPNIGGNFSLKPISDGGDSLSIEIASGEYIRITNRGDIGFDSALPGFGILVEQQDINNGDINSNLVNTDSKNAWLKVIEADGDDALIRNKDSGSSTDTFQVGDKFGNLDSSEGMLIYDNRGRLVTWFATLSSSNNDVIMVNITPVMQINSFNVITPRSPVELLDGEVLFVEVWTNEICNLSIDVFSHSNNIINKTINQLPLGTSLIPIMDVDENTPSNGNLIGEIGCDQNNQRQLDLEWHKVGNRIISDDFYAIIEYSQESTISFTPDYEGQNARIYNVEIQGAASRIADVKNVNSLTPGDDLLISINPDGLLVPGMIARGELVIVDDFGIELRIPIIFEAKSSLNSNTAFSWLSEPGNGLLMISIFLAISVFTGGKEKKRQIINPEYSDIPDF